MMGIQDSNTKGGWVKPQPETELAHENREEEWIHEVNSPREKNGWARVSSSSLLQHGVNT